MAFQAKKFLNDFGIKWTDQGKNSHEGWIQIRCPFCGDKSDHGGFSLEYGNYHCWRCGKHTVYEVIKALTNITNKRQIATICNEYKSTNTKVRVKRDRPVTRPKSLDLPYGTGPLQTIHINYLISRNFDHERLERIWDIKGTGNIGEYKFRIIAPIYFNNTLVSYQGRDVTGRAKLRYKACHRKDEVILHQDLLYGLDQANKNSVVVVEGITDVWRLGPGAVATFGTGVKKSQARLLAKNYSHVSILFDQGDNAQQQAEYLANMICLLDHNCEVEIVQLEGEAKDPAELSDSEAKHIMSALIE